MLKAEMPINVLMIQEQYNNIINLNLPDGVTKEVFDFLYFWREKTDEEQSALRMLNTNLTEPV